MGSAQMNIQGNDHAHGFIVWISHSIVSVYQDVSFVGIQVV